MRHCLCTHKQKRRHFHSKTTRAKLYIYIGVGARDMYMYIDEAHMALDIFRFAVFFVSLSIFVIQKDYTVTGGGDIRP